MKILINSKYFESRIREAIGINADTIYSNKLQINFESKTGRVEMHVEFREASRYNEEFKPDKWLGVAEYLGSILEQPITVVFSYGDIEIYAIKEFTIT